MHLKSIYACVRVAEHQSAVAMQVAQGMTALEAVDPPIVHRDLKPSNIFLDRSGAARVADMNLSLRLHESSVSSLTGETGTYLYMSPEMMRHEVCHSYFQLCAAATNSCHQ